MKIRAVLRLLSLLLLVLPAKAWGEQIVQVTLKDGIHLLLSPEPTSHFIAISVFIRTPRDITSRKRATADLAAHALFYSNTQSTANWEAHLAEEAGGTLDVLYTPDYVALNCVTRRDELEKAAEVLCDALRHAAFTPEALSHARRNITDEWKELLKHPYLEASTRLTDALEGRAAIDSSQLGSISQSETLEYYVTHYTPSAIVISIAGDFPLQLAETDFEAFLEDFERPSPFPRYEYEAPVDAPAERIQLPTMKANGLDEFAMAAVSAPRVDSPDYPAFCVLQALLGSGHASRIFVGLRDKLGIGYRLGASFQARESGPLVASVEWDSKRTSANGETAVSPQQALKLLESEIDSIVEHPPDSQEMIRARSIAIGQDALQHERIRDRAFLIGWYAAMGLGSGFDDRLPAMIEGVTREDVLRAAKKYLSRRAVITIEP